MLVGLAGRRLCPVATTTAVRNDHYFQGSRAAKVRHSSETLQTTIKAHIEPF